MDEIRTEKGRGDVGEGRKELEKEMDEVGGGQFGGAGRKGRVGEKAMRRCRKKWTRWGEGRSEVQERRDELKRRQWECA